MEEGDPSWIFHNAQTEVIQIGLFLSVLDGSSAMQTRRSQKKWQKESFGNSTGNIQPKGSMLLPAATSSSASALGIMLQHSLGNTLPSELEGPS
jgi:hypothetical protein